MKRSVSIALAVLASIIIWLISNLLEDNSDIVSVQVVARSNIVGHSNESGESVTIAAAVSGSGFSLLRLNLNKDRIVTVNIDPSDFSNGEGDFFTISDNALFKYSNDIFGGDVSVRSFISHSVTFRFMKETYKKVPVVPVSFITCRSQYMPLGDIEISLDSVLVYGDPVRLESLDRILTKQISHRDLTRSVHGVVDLDAPAGVRLSQSQATYSQDVTRFVEYTASAPVMVRNLPAGKDLSVFPNTVTVRYRFIFPLSGTPTRGVTFYVDYNEFASSLSGKCMVRCDGLPDVAIDWECEPQMCECVETLLND